MTMLPGVRPIPSGLQQWWVLTRRLVAPTWRNGEAAVGVAVSVAVTAGLYIPLNRLMDTPDLGMSSYAQYVVPLIVYVQAIVLASISTAFRAASDSVQGINRRFQSLPVPALTPLAARITASVYRYGSAWSSHWCARPRHRLPFLPRTAECPGFLCAAYSTASALGAPG